MRVGETVLRQTETSRKKTVGDNSERLAEMTVEASRKKNESKRERENALKSDSLSNDRLA